MGSVTCDDDMWGMRVWKLGVNRVFTTPHSLVTVWCKNCGDSVRVDHEVGPLTNPCEHFGGPADD